MRACIVGLSVAGLLLSWPAVAANYCPAHAYMSPKWQDGGWRVLSRVSKLHLDEEGRPEFTYEFENKAFNESGVKAIFEEKYNYDPNRQDIRLENFATVKADGSVVPVDPVAILDRTADATLPEPYLDDKRIKVVVFPDLAPGDTVRGRVVWSQRKSEPGRRFANFWLHAVDLPIALHKIVVDSPASLALRSNAVGAAETVERKGDRVVRTVVFPERDPVALTTAADLFDVSPRYEVSNFSSYADVAEYMRGKNYPAAKADVAIAAKAKALVAGAADAREKVKRIYDWVAQNVRYVAIETDDFGNSSLPAATTFANRFGDCKAHVTLLKAMLETVGEPAHMVLVNSGPQYTLPDLPSLNFDHAIVFAPSVGFYLDATSYLTPFGSLPPPLADKPALDIETGELTRLPVATPADVKVVAESHVDIAADGAATTRTVLGGDNGGETIRRSLGEWLEAGDPKTQLGELLRSYGHEGGGDVKFSNPRDLMKPYEVTANYVVNDHRSLDDVNARIAFDNPVDWAAQTDWTIYQNNGGVAWTCSPVDYTDIVTATLPEGYSIADLPPPRDFEDEAHGHTALGDVTGKFAFHSAFEGKGRDVKLTTHATFAFSRGLCDAHVLDRVAQTAEWLNRYRYQRLPVHSPNVSPMRQWLQDLLVQAHHNLE